MSDELRAPDSDDLSADTERFRRFARQDGEVSPDRATGAGFRLLTLAAGLLVLALVIWLLLR